MPYEFKLPDLGEGLAEGEIARWLGDGDPTTRRTIEEILAVEEEHADDMLTLLKQMDSPN